MGDLGKTLILFGVVLMLAGAVLTFAGRLPWIGRLPGDFTFRRYGIVFYFPLATGILLSIVMSVLLSLFRR
jgi:hypothetical protein